ncbi:hypothetical protein EGW08_019717 [Elysia chlorotica]|uniref:Reverse transcriptase domain-containing protein n=1 Tax=Elysia chlorotica TaxID=188477 RepID=A0A3S1AZR5_ELYCH|nr:hypothetical protein EGW08_019717 [Elysia chlorotica]
MVGDGLSPVLFIIYLEHALKEVRKVIGEPKSPLEEKIPREIAYADDVDFVGLEYIDIDAVQRTLHKYNLKVNVAKTTHSIVNNYGKVLNIYYPTKISNKTLYTKCNEKPLSIHILESRWRLFGHILRRNEEIPANKAMQLYFHRTEKRFRGRPTTTLPVTINKDLSQIQDNLSLKSTDDLEYLRSLAQDRNQWKSLTKQIVEIAEASRSDDQDAKSE